MHISQDRCLICKGNSEFRFGINILILVCRADKFLFVISEIKTNPSSINDTQQGY